MRSEIRAEARREREALPLTPRRNEFSLCHHHLTGHHGRSTGVLAPRYAARGTPSDRRIIQKSIAEDMPWKKQIPSGYIGHAVGVVENEIFI